MRGIGLRVLGRYVLVRRLAGGAVAQVFLATDGEACKAVKLFPPEAAARAEREYRHGVGLHHPNLNPVEALEPLGDNLALVLPFVRGPRLDKLLGPAALGYLPGVLDGLAHLHAQGVVHRDVKPENVIVAASAEGAARPVLFDFDLAVRRGEAALEPPAGTIAYVSPEQVRGEAATPQSDLYGVGVTLYRCLTGQVPFSGSVPEVMAAHARDAVPPPSSFAPRLARFDDLSVRLLAKRPEARPGGAREVGLELRALLAEG